MLLLAAYKLKPVWVVAVARSYYKNLRLRWLRRSRGRSISEKKRLGLVKEMKSDIKSKSVSTKEGPVSDLRQLL